MPMFSIVIPTKNRAELVLNTARHILKLSWKDLELVIIDNDDSDETSQALRGVRDKRLRVVRTGGLAMPENWEEGFKAAEGDYIFIQSDRLRIVPNMLNVVAARIKSHKPKVIKCSMGATPYNGDAVEYDEEGWCIAKSKWIIRAVLDSDVKLIANFLPNGYSSFYSKELVRGIQKKYGRMSFRMTPDFTPAFASLFTVPEIHQTNHQAFTIAPSLSAGISYQYGGELGMSSLRHMDVSGDELVKNAKIKFSSIPFNTIFSDFFTIAKMMGQKYTHADVDDVKYVTFLFKELMRSKYYYHIDVTEDLRKIYNFLEQSHLMYHPEIVRLMEEYNFFNIINGVSGHSSVPYHAIVLWECLGKENKRVAVFGAGKHTQWLEQATMGITPPNVVAVLDDRGAKAPRYFGRTPTPPKEFDPSLAEIIFISSDDPDTIAHMSANCQLLYGDKVKVLLPYRDLPPGPYDKRLILREGGKKNK